MEATARAYWLHALTPLHVGAGRGAGFIDLPVMREKITEWPVVPGSTVKGVLRDHYDRTLHGDMRELFKRAFGTATGSGDGGSAGALILTDARLVLMPVRSLYGTFAYVTSPLALRRLARDLEVVGGQVATALPERIGDVSLEELSVPAGSVLCNQQKSCYLEDLDFRAQPDDRAAEWAEYLSTQLFAGEGGNGADAWSTLFRERFAIAHDEVFGFLTQYATEVSARVRIGEMKRVENGALWYEESLPTEAVLAGLAFCDRVPGGGFRADEIVSAFCQETLTLQLGGKATIGKGRVRCLFRGKE